MSSIAVAVPVKIARNDHLALGMKMCALILGSEGFSDCNGSFYCFDPTTMKFQVALM